MPNHPPKHSTLPWRVREDHDDEDHAHIDDAIAEEREECARVANDMTTLSDEPGYDGCAPEQARSKQNLRIAAAIRARKS